MGSRADYTPLGKSPFESEDYKLTFPERKIYSEIDLHEANHRELEEILKVTGRLDFEVMNAETGHARETAERAMGKIAETGKDLLIRCGGRFAVANRSDDLPHIESRIALMFGTAAAIVQQPRPAISLQERAAAAYTKLPHYFQEWVDNRGASNAVNRHLDTLVARDAALIAGILRNPSAIDRWAEDPNLDVVPISRGHNRRSLSIAIKLAKESLEF